MDIKAHIQKDRIEAMKAGQLERKATLDYVLGEIQKKEKDPGAKGDIATAVISSYLKSLRELIAQVGTERPEQAAKYQAEVDLLMAYLPKQLSDDEIRAEAEAIRATGEERKGVVMKALKEKHGAALDGRRAIAVLEAMGFK
mgnify:CR=1 FL=1